MKGIVLAGGTGSRLWPATYVVSKQLLPIYDKPMIYYPISTLMLAGIREILIITRREDQVLYRSLLGDGSKFGINLEYAIQDQPRGLAEAFIIGNEFIGTESVGMILGDNIFYGAGIGSQLKDSFKNKGAQIFTMRVANPQDFGVLETDSQNRPISISEKPDSPKSNLAVTGLYFFDNSVLERARSVFPSRRGELEITSIIESYMLEGKLNFTTMGRGTAWLDTGTPSALNDASNFVRIIEDRTGLKIACLEEIGLRNGWLMPEKLKVRLSNDTYMTQYSKYLDALLDQF
jgi:glucose-1-phosphate thymidylyltransferase